MDLSPTFDSHILQPENWTSPLAALLTIDSYLDDEITRDANLRTVNFMSYELSTLCQGQPPDKTFEILNSFFFKTKNFHLTNTPCLLRSILRERNGCGIALGLLYMHLAQTLGLKLQLVHWPLHAILKWECDNKCHYFDLQNNGEFLSGEELLEMINKHKDQVKTLSLREALSQYLMYLSFSFRHNKEKHLLHKTLNLMLHLEPENVRFLAERALLRYELGLLKEALSDFKRYFSFTEKETASVEIQTAYARICEMPSR